MKGRVWRRCGCRDEHGKQYSADHPCPKLGDKGHGSWAYRVALGRDPGTGKRLTEYRQGFTTKRAAEAELVKVITEHTAGQHRHDGRQTVGDYLTRWIAEKVADGELRASTAHTYQRYVALDLSRHLGAVRLRDLRASHVKEMLRKLRTTEGRGDATVRQIHAVLRSALTSARRDGLIAGNPAADVSLGGPRPAKVRPWEPAELGAFLDSASGHRLGALFELLAMTGLRRGEALGLRWADVDLSAGMLTVRRQLVAVGARVTEGAPKTRAGEDRRVSLSQHVVGILLAHQFAQQAEREAWGDAYEDGDWVFCAENGASLSPGYVTKLFHKLVTQADVRQIRLHDLRHGAASIMLASGTQMAEVSKVLGHSSVRITSDTYHHLLAGAGRSIAEAAQALIPRQTHTAAHTGV